MPDLFHVWAYYHSKTFDLVIYQPNDLWYKLYRLEQSTKFHFFSSSYIDGNIIQNLGPLTLLWIIFIMILTSVYMKGIDSTKWRYKRLGTHVQRALQPRLRRNFPKDSECFGMVLVVKIWEPARLRFQNPPSRFEMLRKVSSAKVAGKEA